MLSSEATRLMLVFCCLLLIAIFVFRIGNAGLYSMQALLNSSSTFIDVLCEAQLNHFAFERAIQMLVQWFLGLKYLRHTPEAGC